MGMIATTTNLTYARNDYIKQGRSHIFDKCADMIWYMMTNDDISTAGTVAEAITRTDATAPENAFYALEDIGVGYSAGSINAVKGAVTSSAVLGQTVRNMSAGWFGLTWEAAFAATGAGATRAINAEVVTACASTYGHPNAILYLQSIPSGVSSSHATMPYIVFSETATGTGSDVLFEVGHGPAATTPTIGTGNLFYQNTLRIFVNETAGNRTAWYIPLSSAEATYTTAYPVVITNTLTTGVNGTGHDVIIDGDTSGANLTWDADTDSLEFTNSFLSMGDMDIGVPTTDAIKHTLEVHTEPAAGLSASGGNFGIRSRYHITGAQTAQITFVALEGRMRVKADMADGLITAVCGTIETDAMDFTGTSTTQRNAGTFSLDFATGTTITGGWLCGVAIDSAMHSAVDLASCTCAGLRISVGGSKEPWTHGIYISDAVTGITITGSTSVGINCSAAVLHASAGRIAKFVGSVADADQGDGYGVFEVQANFSGTVPSGSVANASSFWINLSGSTVTAGTILCVQNNGIWAPGGLTLSTTTMVIGMRMHCEISGGTQPNEIFCFSTNIVANHITSLWQINVIEDINTSSTKSGSSVAVPFLKTSAGTQYYVNAYTS